jgi:hypothetical protein
VSQATVGGKAYLSTEFTASATSSDGPPVDYVIEYNQPFQIAGRPVRVKF